MDKNPVKTLNSSLLTLHCSLCFHNAATIGVICLKRTRDMTDTDGTLNFIEPLCTGAVPYRIDYRITETPFMKKVVKRRIRVN